MSLKITLDALEVLDAIDRKGSFAAAASALYRVPSALTYSVKKLEEDLGVVLFRKEGRRSVLTPSGLVLLEQGRELLQAAERLVETTRRVHTGWESTFNIAFDSIINFNHLYSVLDEFYAMSPDVEINIYEEVLGGAWESVIEDRADLVIGAPEPPSHIQGLCTKPLYQEQWLFAVAYGHPLTKIGRTLTEKDIQPYRSVVVRDSSRHLPPLTRRVFDQQAQLRVCNLQQKIEAQVKGLGVGFLPKSRIVDALEEQRLVILETEQQDGQNMPLHLVWKSGHRGKALSWFVDRFSEPGFFVGSRPDSKPQRMN